MPADANRPDPDASAEELHADIAAARAELGETIGAISEKVDVKHQVEQRKQLVKDAVGQQARDATAKAQENSGLIIGVLAAVVVVVGVIVVVRRR